MKTLGSYVEGKWHHAKGGFASLRDPCSEEVIAQASSDGVDFGAVLDYARRQGGAALRELTLAQRGALLQAMSGALHELQGSRSGRGSIQAAADQEGTLETQEEKPDDG